MAGQEGCFAGCLRSILAGGTLGTVLGYLAARLFYQNPPKKEMFYLLRWGFSMVGFPAGVLLWALGEAVFFLFFVKSPEEGEDKI